MAQTDARAGFRLPWNSERSNSEQTDTEVEQAQAAQADADPATDGAPVTRWGTEETTSADSQAPTGEPDNEAPAAMTSDAPETTAQSASSSPRKQSKFMTDLTKAMQVAAEEARSRTLTQFQAEAKAYVEQIHGRSSTEATELRRKADDDVAAVREWSKAEIARIREETESQITTRKSRLDGEIDGHAAMIEREIEQVQSRVASFEQEMEAFFVRLLAEEDPTHFATMAERLPEPPPFEDMFDASLVAEPAEAVETETTEETAEVAYVLETADETAAETAAETETPVEDVVETVETPENEESTANVEADADVATDTQNDEETGAVDDDFVLDRESAFAAIQAAAEAAASAEVASDAAERAEAVADIIDIVGHHEGESDDPDDLRKAALGLTPDYDAAEAEAAASADASGAEGEEIPEIGDDALAARLAGLVPGKGSDRGRSSESTSTQVVVVGLVSVASIASFKRHLGRLPGVQSVGVSSGPDGEFLFAVHHSADVVLRDAIPSMPSFQARVTGHGEGTLNVSAHDPESDN